MQADVKSIKENYSSELGTTHQNFQKLELNMMQTSVQLKENLGKIGNLDIKIQEQKAAEQLATQRLAKNEAQNAKDPKT